MCGSCADGACRFAQPSFAALHNAKIGAAPRGVKSPIRMKPIAAGYRRNQLKILNNSIATSIDRQPIPTVQRKE
jgi:hypothetical protein